VEAGQTGDPSKGKKNKEETKNRLMVVQEHKGGGALAKMKKSTKLKSDHKEQCESKNISRRKIKGEKKKKEGS